MILGVVRRGWTLALLPWLGAPVQAQMPFLPPLPSVPSLPQPINPELQSCVARFGHTGCAARLYARLLCDSVGRTDLVEVIEPKLAEQFEQAAIDFRGITPEQVEMAAVRYYSPMLCLEKSVQIRQLFSAS